MPEGVVQESERVRVRDKWQTEGSGSHYATERWRSSRRKRRDPRIVAELLDAHGAGTGTILDAACGPARLRDAIGSRNRRWTGLDVSASMLSAAHTAGATPLVRGDVERLPFATDAFDAVVANRLLHHMRRECELVGVLTELVRVSRRLVVASFWNSVSWPGLRRVLGLARDEGTSGRVARTVGSMRAASERAGARILQVRHAAPLLSQQSFVVLEKLR